MPDVFLSKERNEPFKTDKQSIPAPSSSKMLPFLSSFCEKPNGIEFVSQEENEKIIIFIRRHFITNISWISIGIILLVAPLFLIFPFNILQDLLKILPSSFIVILLIFYYLIIVGYVYTNFITWFYNVGIITSKQIIDVDFTDIMYREVAKVRIQDIIDAEYTQGGFLHSFFNYGDVFIQTEGIKPNFEFYHIPNPDKTTDIIIDLKGESNVK